MSNVAIVGTGMTEFGKFPDASLGDLAQQAAREALADAGVTPSEVEAVYAGNAIAGLILGQEMIRGQVALAELGLGPVQLFNVENACASGSSAFNLAVQAVRAGSVKVALVVGTERMVHHDRSRAGEALKSAADVTKLPEYEREFYGAADDGRPRAFFMDLYAKSAVEYTDRTGATVDDLADVAVKSREYAAHNPRAQFRKPVTREEVLASRIISEPLTLMMCSPIGDGAAAVVVADAEFAQKRDIPAVKVLASAQVAGMDPAVEPAERAAHLAYETAGAGPEDIDVVELHDAAAPAELMLCEQLGLAAPGQGAGLLASGQTRLGGRVPVNPSGGLMARGHPVGATGVAQLVELAEQLRGRSGARQTKGARIALAENHGGYMAGDPAAAVVTILQAT